MSNPSVMLYVPFALNGKKNTIQVTRQTNQDEEDATWSDGFPDVTMIKESVGGKAPKGLDFNGVFYSLSADTVHRQSGNQIQYDATYATNIGGYSKGAVVQSTDLSKFWISTVDENLTDPDSTSASGWSRFAYTPVATSTTLGTVKLADNLTSTATDTALTANQGSVLNAKINTLFTNSSIGSSNGYIYLGSLLLQWGSIDYDTNPGEVQATVTFPVPFPKFVANIQATRKMSQQSANGDGGVNIISQSLSTATFSLQTYNNSNSSDVRGFNWFAIGN